MKKLFSIVLLMACSIALVAQEMPDNLWQADEPTNPYGCEYVANEVIVKFKHTSPVRIQRHNTTRRFVSASVTEVDMVLDSLGIFDVEDLMPLTGHMVSQKVMTVGGKRLAPDQNLSKLCNIVFDTAKVATVDEAIAMLERLPEVEYAEPNYIVRIMSSSASDTIYDHLDAEKYIKEPLYSQQWGPKAINLPWLWDQPKSKKRPVIAILDTGVDIEHPDLKDNIWTNEAEENGAGGKDDDKNGFFDDIHGYDFVNNTGVIGDRNGHGTHCAGIAAAVGNNGIGITGANPDALIMPVQVMDKAGSGSVSTIIKGIDYANANGADILSMSFGGCYSYAEEEALLKAFYNDKYLIAASGNNGLDIYITACPSSPMGRYFPAALSFVFGVMSTDKSGKLSSFSNYDSDGPYYADWAAEGSTIDEAQTYWNYDIAAPGSKIISTFLNGTYREMSGTSMSTPLVAGALSRLLQCRTYSSQESAMGVIIQNRDTVKSYNNLDVQKSMEFDELNVSPVLVVTNYQIVDTINGGNGDGKPNPGETIEIYPTVRCIYGNAYGVSVHMYHGLNVDTTTLDLIQRKAELYNLSPSSSVRSKTPIIAKVADRCEDGYTIQLFADLHFDSVPGIEMSTSSAYARKLVLEIEETSYLSGVLDTVLTLGSDKKHVIKKTFALSENAHLIIKPGTKVFFDNSSSLNSNSGKVTMHGTPDSMIVFTDLYPNAFHYCKVSVNKNDTLKYVHIDNLSLFGGLNAILYNSIVSNCDNGLLIEQSFYNCNIYKNSATYAYSANGGMTSTNMFKGYDMNIYTSNIVENYGGSWKSGDICTWRNTSSYSSVIPHNCNILGNTAFNVDSNSKSLLIAIDHSTTTSRVKLKDPCYFGTTDMDIIQGGVLDVLTGNGLSQLDLSNRLDRPVKEAHGIVWKIHVDGEEILPYKRTSTPIGVGKHKFEVYYNRAMDISINPTISFGVRTPYTQHIVAEDPSWSVDSTIFTAYYTIGARTMTDGINHVHITGGRDDEYFPAVDETTRFDIIVQATGSLATGLFAEAGLGKVTLQWETDEEDFEDLMGYHIYRWTEVLDSTEVEIWDDETGDWIYDWEFSTRIDTTIINDILLTPEETMFVDYDVVPGKSYYYEIQQVTTSFEEYNFSNPVCATPLTATKGDANGSMSVDVADVVTEVAYLTGQNPQPFIFEAADVNSDQIVNILDIVGTVNIIKNPAVSSLGFSDNNTATYSIEDGILYIETPIVLGGVQFSFNADAEISVLEALNGFETTTWTTATSHNFMAYSMSGKVLEVGKHALLYVGDAELNKIVLSNAQGQNVPAIKKVATGLSSVESMQMRLPNPNPFKTYVTIPYVVGQAGKHNVQLVFTNLAGMVVHSYSATKSFGEYNYTWKPAGLPEGVYFVTLIVDGKKMQTSKLIRVK